MDIKKIKGTRDYFGTEAEKLTVIKDLLQSIVTTYDFSLVQFPNIEYAVLFTKAVGETTDVVSKEMFS
jgi:histidyl-tRNA synthetase